MKNAAKIVNQKIISKIFYPLSGKIGVETFQSLNGWAYKNKTGAESTSEPVLCVSDQLTALKLQR